MAYITISSGLTIKVPTRGTRNWADEMLAQTFTKISSHDHTGSGKGLAIGTNALSAGAVTLAKMADIATDRLIGRDTAGSGVPEALTVGGGLEFSGSGGIQRSALTGNVTASAGSGVTTIAAGVVTEAMLADDAATRSCVLCEFDYSITTGTLSISQSDLRSIVPKACKVTHISLCLPLDAGSPITFTGGTYTITLYKNGSTTSQVLTLTSGEAYDFVAITAQSFAAGDRIGFAETAAAVTISKATTGRLALWGHFTEQ